ncbi:MAG: SMP-30/gluconolactonase/LRE family protein, partial [Planctomycetaceae bacterium]
PLTDLDETVQGPDATARKVDGAGVPGSVSAPDLPPEAESDHPADAPREQAVSQSLPLGDGELRLPADAEGETPSVDRGTDNPETDNAEASGAAPLLPEIHQGDSDAAIPVSGGPLLIPASPSAGDGSVPFSDSVEATVPRPASRKSGLQEPLVPDDVPVTSEESVTDRLNSEEQVREPKASVGLTDDQEQFGPRFLPGAAGESAAEAEDLPAVFDGTVSENSTSENSTSENSTAKSGQDVSRPRIVELPEVTPGPRQPMPPDITGALPRVEEPSTLPDAVASVIRPDENTEALPQIVNNSNVYAVEIATFSGSADGIVFDMDGTAYVSHHDSISKVTLDGEVTRWLKTGGPRGHAILGDGAHLICDISQRAVLHLDAEGNLLGKVATESAGHLLRAPDDIVVDQAGGFYFTDPGHARVRSAIGKVYYVAPGGQVSVVVSKLAFPEGIALARDGSALFIAESQKNRIVKCDLQTPGKAGPPEVFCDLPRQSRGHSDGFVGGLVNDREGWLYVAHRGMSRVEVIGPDGDWRTSFHCPNTIVSNLAFSPDDSRLFVTGSSREMSGRLMSIDFVARR